MSDDPQVIKICKKCGPLILSQVRFRKDKPNQSLCIKCEYERKKIQRTNDPQKFKEHGDKYRYLERPLDTKELSCSKCKETKDINDFTKNMINIRYPYCRDCSRAASTNSRKKPEQRQKTKDWYNKTYKTIADNAYYVKRYGITLDQYNLMSEQQNHMCAICRNPEPCKTKNGTPMRLYVDHDHSTGAIRKLLCIKCNMGMGSFNDDPKLMFLAVKYLREHSTSAPCT